nr:hypothetical protein Iba_chr13aCG12920 [Ipomoea batatas]GMD78857.1 hypothetical protein Iba_chr13cCG17020 [Ipomoea batatas]
MPKDTASTINNPLPKSLHQKASLHFYSRFILPGLKPDGANQEAADEETEGKGGQEEACAHGFHALWGLGEEEIELACVHVGFPSSDQEELADTAIPTVDRTRPSAILCKLVKPACMVDKLL